MGLVRNRAASHSTLPPSSSTGEAKVFTRSGVVPAGAHADHGLPKMWDDLGDEEVTGETNLIPASRRARANPHLVVMTGSAAGQVIALDASQIVVGRSRSAQLRVVDDGISRTHCRLLRRGDAIIIEDLGSTNGTVVNGTKVARAELAAGDRIQLGPELTLQLSMYDDAEQTLARKLFDTSTRDPLTGIFNRHYFAQRLDAEMSHARRHDTQLSVMMLDIDGLRSINDALGREAGDDVLRAFAQTIGRTIRAEDLFCRYDDAKFAFLVREPLRSATQSAERLRKCIESMRVTVGRKTVTITASVGVAEAGEPGAQLTGEGLTRVAERRLTRAKALGKNRVCAE